ncbi:MAG TPA: hypothetical protein PKJ94_03775 [Ferruginibacter sp.]|nr:hypothetical protein [Ferruginibacter sp.]
MKLRQEILKEHSKAQCTKIVNWVGGSQQRFDELFRLFLNDEYRVVQRAAWPLSYCVIAHPSFISKHWKQLLDNLKKPNLHDSVKRNSIRLMEDIDIPEKFHGEVMNICFGYLESPAEPLAVKVFSMSVLAKLAKEYPEIKTELKLIIEDQLPHQTAGFKSRAKKILKEFARG